MTTPPQPPLVPGEREPYWNGPAGKGAMRKLRGFKRQEAQERNAVTLPENRSRKLRKDTGGTQ